MTKLELSQAVAIQIRRSLQERLVMSKRSRNWKLNEFQIGDINEAIKILDSAIELEGNRIREHMRQFREKENQNETKNLSSHD